MPSAFLINVANEGFSLPLDWFTMRQKDIFKVYSLKPEVDFGCKTVNLPSTFQISQERKIINGIF